MPLNSDEPKPSLLEQGRRYAALTAEAEATQDGAAVKTEFTAGGRSWSASLYATLTAARDKARGWTVGARARWFRGA